jgi:hypothetical protein
MKESTKQIIQSSFYQLLFVYAILVLLIALSLFWKYSLQFSIFALIIAVMGLVIISREDKELRPLNKKLHYALFVLAILLIIVFRFIPYIDNSVPLGYDAGIYKYGIEHGLENSDKWILSGGMEPGFLYLMEAFKLFFSVDFILTYLLIGFCVLLGIAVYFVSKEFFDKTTALIALLIYSVSIIQFRVFTFMYYKNIIALSLALFSIYFLKKYEKYSKKKLLWLFIIFAGLLGSIHRPTFYIFGLSYFFYAFISPYKNKKYEFGILRNNIIYGIIVLIFAGIFYLGKFRNAILVIIRPVLESFVETGNSPGTFLSFFGYQYSTLFYLPFAIIGFFALAKRKQFNMLFLWTLITALIVYFQFFFFNRFIIHLDIGLIILASLGFSTLLNNKKRFGIIILIVMLLSAGFVSLNEARNTKPLITESQLELIKEFQNTEQSAYVMSISSEYSPWVLGYSERKTIAPGLFDYNKWNLEQWNIFWATPSKDETIELMYVYDNPIYLFVGDKEFNNTCFEVYKEKENNKIMKYIC